MERLKVLVDRMNSEGLDQLIISDPTSIFYFTGRWIHAGERMIVLLVSKNGDTKFFVNRLFPQKEDGILKIVWMEDVDDQIAILGESIFENGVVGVDKLWVARFLLPLMKLKNSVEFVDGSRIVDDIRGVKSADEIDKMRNSSYLNDRAMDMMKKELLKGKTELEMGKKLMEFYNELGSKAFSFEPIVAYGANAADPHHENDDSLLKEGDSIVVDMGCVLDDYCSDMTRTFFYKKASDEAIKVYETVLEANLAGIAKVKPGVTFAEIDKAARDVIEKAGYGKYFTHRTGHFIGLETHEAGDVSQANHNVVKAGNIFSIEPGIYLPGVVGVRIEDLVVATDDGCEILNRYDKSLTIIE